MYCYFQYAFLCGHLEENKATRQGFEVACMRCIAQNSAASPPSPRVFKSQPSRSRQHHDFVFLFSILIMASLGPVVPLQHLNSSGNNTSGGQPAPSPSAPNQSVTVPPHSLSSLPATPSTLITAVPTSNVLDTSGPSTLNGSIGCAPSSGATTITTASTATTATIPPLPHRPFKQEHRLIRLATSAKVWTVLGGILGFIAFIYTIILNKWTARNDALQACNSMPDAAKGSTYCARLISEGVTQPPIRRALQQLEQMSNSKHTNLGAAGSVSLARTVTVTLSVGVFTLVWSRPRMRLTLRPIISLVRQTCAVISSTVIYGQLLIWPKNLGQGDTLDEKILLNDDNNLLPGCTDEPVHEGGTGIETLDDANDYGDEFRIYDNAIESGTDMDDDWVDRWENLPAIDGLRYNGESDLVLPVIFRGRPPENCRTQTCRNGLLVKWTTLNAGDVHFLHPSPVVTHLQASKSRLSHFRRESGIHVCDGIVVAENGQLGGIYNVNRYNEVCSIESRLHDACILDSPECRRIGLQVCSIFQSLLHEHYFHYPFLLDNVRFVVERSQGGFKWFTIVKAVYLVGVEDLKQFSNTGDESAGTDDIARAETEEEKILRYTQSIKALGDVLSVVLGLEYEDSNGEIRKIISLNDWSKEETDANYRRLAYILMGSEPCTSDGLLSFFSFDDHTTPRPRKRLRFMGILGHPDRASSDIADITDMSEDLPDQRGTRQRLKRLFRRQR